MEADFEKDQTTPRETDPKLATIERASQSLLKMHGELVTAINSEALRDDPYTHAQFNALARHVGESFAITEVILGNTVDDVA